jgi:hypothetical protein
LVKNLVYFLKGTVHQTYKITQIISEYGLVKKVRIIFVFFIGLSFASLEAVESIIQEKTQIERQVENSSLGQAMESSKNPSAIIISGGGDLGKGNSAGARAKSDARAAVNKKVKALKSKPGRKGVAEAWAPGTSKSSRPAGANRLAQQFSTGPIAGGNKLFGRFSAQPTPDPYNPGCSSGPRSVVISSQSNANLPTTQFVREITAYDGVKGKLSDKSLSHLMSKHADAIGIDDPLPPNPNQKPTPYKQTNTRVNNENKEKFGDILEKILEDPNTEPFPDVSIRGIKSHGYYSEDYGFFVGIHNEGEFTGQIKKAQSVSPEQLKTLQEKNKID